MSRTLREAAQMALDALRQCEFTSPPAQRPIVKDAIAALRSALAAPPAAPAPAAPVTHEAYRLADALEKEIEECRLASCEEMVLEAVAILRKMPAPAPAAPVPDGWVMVPREPTPEMIAAMPYPANTIPAVGVACYRAMITASPAAPAQPVPLTDEQIRSMWKSSEFRGNGGQADWFCEGIRAAEAHLGITGGKP